MQDEIPEKPRSWICPIVLVVCVIVIVVLWIVCPWKCVDGPDESKAKLVIENSETTSWMTINNSFKGDLGEFCANCWHGVLAHTGSYVDGMYKCKQISLRKGGNPIPGGEFTCKDEDQFFFVNIAPDGASPPPMVAADHASYLAPWGMDEVCCGQLESCNAGENAPADPATCWQEYKTCRDPGPNVFRPRRTLHHKQNVRSMVSFWHDDSAYDVGVELLPGDESKPPRDRLEFRFDYAPRVEVFQFSVAEGANCAWNPKLTAVYPQVDEVRIEWEKVVPDVTIHSDPPWPINKSGP